jgi:cysteine desulfurase / selenocysteine lyase
MDLARLRDDFPILRTTVHGHPLIYLDSAATSQKPTAVVDAVREYYAHQNANPHRGVYELSVTATEAYEAARARVARFLHAPDPNGVVFVRGTTEGLNLVAQCLGQDRLARGDRVLTTVMEHHSNIVPWHQLRTTRGVEVDFVGIDAEGRLRLGDYDRLLGPKTKVVTLTHVSNVLGTVNPVAEIARRAHEVGALVVVDLAQSAPHRPVDVTALGADFVAFSGHKTLGPMGIGALWGRPELLAELPPYMGGGEMITEVHRDRVAYREPPARFEAGTPNVAGAVGLSAALDYLEAVGWEDLHRHEAALFERFARGSKERFGSAIRVYGPPAGPDREAVISFSVEGIHPHDLASLLDADGIAIRAGHHCAQPLMDELRVPALARASPYLYNTAEEIDRLLTAIGRAIDLFARGSTPRPAAT